MKIKKMIFLLVASTGLVFGLFVRDDYGVVEDDKSGLAWQDNYSDNNGEIKEGTWQDALVYCHELILEDKNDWRLPNRNELLSLTDIKLFNPSINDIFQNTISEYYWSSTTQSEITTGAWPVNFNNGDSNWNQKSEIYYIRCVRGGEE